MNTRLAIFHDYFAIRGGGERLVLTLAEAFGGTLVYGYRTEDTYETGMFPADRRDLSLPQVLRRGAMHPLALAALFAGQRRAAEKFDIRIYSGVAAPFAAPARSATARSIYYCHTPPRFLFDQREHFLSRFSRAKRLAALPVLARYEASYRRAIDRMDVIIANSETVRERISRYLGRDSVIVYPPTDEGRYHWAAASGYYLSTGRLAPLKRIATIIDAFLLMPDKRLIVASGGNDFDALVARANGAANIQFTGWTDDATQATLMAGAVATIYVPRDEDFGMSPVESMSAGKPVIGVAEGGVAETVLDGITGRLLSPGFGAADLVDAVRAMTPDRALGMRGACEARAALFSRGRFVASMREIVDSAKSGDRGTRN